MRMSCGACGHWQFELYEDDRKGHKSILVQCNDCESITEVSVTEPELKVDWPVGIRSQGILCVMPGEQERIVWKRTPKNS